MELDNLHLKPGQKVHIGYGSNKSKKKFTVAVPDYNGWVLVEVTDNNRDCILGKWKGYEHPFLIGKFHLELDKSYFWVDNYAVKPVSRLEI